MHPKTSTQPFSACPQIRHALSPLFKWELGLGPSPTRVSPLDVYYERERYSPTHESRCNRRIPPPLSIPGHSPPLEDLGQSCRGRIGWRGPGAEPLPTRGLFLFPFLCVLPPVSFTSFVFEHPPHPHARGKKASSFRTRDRV